MLSRLFTALIGKQSRHKSRRSQRIAARRAGFQALEQRQLLAVTSIQAFDDVAPAVASFQAAAVTNDNRLAIAIRTPHSFALTDVSLLRNDGSGLAVQQFENVPTNAAGVAWISTPALPDGDYLVRARAGLYAKYFFICDPGLAAFEAEGSLSFRVDTSRPVPTVSSAVAEPTNSADPLSFVVNFSEPVQGFQASDAVVTNGAIQGMVVSGPSSFTIFVRPVAAGEVSLRIPFGVAADAASNPNTASNRLAIAFDPTPPALVSVARGPGSSAVTNADSLVFRTTFSEAVANVDATDFVAAGTTAVFTGAVQVGPRIFDLTLSGGDLANLNGPVKLDLKPGNNIADLAGTPLSARKPATDQRFFLDNTRPTVRLSTAVASPTNAAAIWIRAVFSEAVVGLTPSDIVVTNGTVRSLSGSGKVYGFAVEPAADGIVTVRVPGASARDAAGNDNIVSGIVSIRSDRTSPSAVLSTTIISPTNNAVVPIRLQFNEPVSGFTLSDLVITNGTASNLTGKGSTYRFNVTPSADGLVTIRLPQGVALDAARNSNTAAAPLSLLSDQTQPTALVSSSSASPTSAGQIPFHIQFSEPVRSFAAGDIQITNGSLASIVGSGAAYDILVTPNADGLVTVTVAGGAAKDAAGNRSLAAAPVSIRSDRTAPTVDVSSALASPTNAGVIPFKIVFSEPVIGFVQGDVQVVNGSIADFTANADGSFTVNVTPNGDGLVRLTVPAGSARDTAGNDNTAGSFAVTSDRTAPRATLTYNPPPAGSLVLGTVTITFTEPVIGFDIGDLALRFPEAQFPLTADMLSGSGATYTLDLSRFPIQPGDYLLALTAAGSDIFDLAGNPLLADASTTWTHTFGNP
jgi:hypothetical protein